jgi:hypothetical protein
MGQLGVGAGEDAGQGLHHGHLAAQLGVEGADLHADVAGPDHHQALGDLAEGQRAGRVHHPVAVEGEAGDLHRARAGGDDDGAGLDGEGLAGVGALALDLQGVAPG